MGSRRHTFASDTANERATKDRGPAGALDTKALRVRSLTPEQIAEEADLVLRCIQRVRVVDDPEETAIVRVELRSMLLGES